MRIIKQLNYFFLHDEDETAPLSDYVWFYGTLSFLSIFGVIFTVLNITN